MTQCCHLCLSPFHNSFLSEDKVLCRHWTRKKESVAQIVIPECYVPAVLMIVHDGVIAGHPGKERTLTAARARYFWLTMSVDIDSYVSQYVKCAQNKGSVPRPAPILEYPPPDRPWDVVSIDLLQLPASNQGSKYLLVCVDHLSRYVVLAPIKDKSANSVAHALITRLFCPYSTPRVLLSDNGAEFRNQLLSEICTQFGIKQSFTVSYHPASNGLVERANRKILDVLRPVVCGLLHTWEDWLPHVAASINSSVCESTGQSPHFILFGVEQRLPYDLLSTFSTPVYNVDDYVKCQLKVFSDIHKTVKRKLQDTKTAMCEQQHRRASPVTLQVGDSVMVRVPERGSKLSPKFEGPRLITKKLGGHKFEVTDHCTNTTEVVHSDRLKKTSAQPEDVATSMPAAEAAPATNTARDSNACTSSHSYNLRPRQ